MSSSEWFQWDVHVEEKKVPLETYHGVVQAREQSEHDPEIQEIQELIDERESYSLWKWWPLSASELKEKFEGFSEGDADTLAILALQSKACTKVFDLAQKGKLDILFDMSVIEFNKDHNKISVGPLLIAFGYLRKYVAEVSP